MAYDYSQLFPSLPQTPPVGVLAPTPAPNSTSTTTGQPVYSPLPTPATKPVTLLSSKTGADIVADNKTKLSTVESSIGSYQGVDIKPGTDAEVQAQIAAINAGNNPASTKMRSEISDATSQGGMTADERAGQTALQQSQDAVTTAAAKARAALDSKDYTSMDYWTNKATAAREESEKQLADYYEQTSALRARMTQNMTPSEKEQQLGQQVIDIRSQAEQFKLQTEEDKFREYEGQTMGFAGGRASEIDIRASFKNQELALKEKNLLLSLGLEQGAREMEGKSIEQQLTWLADDLELQQKVQEKITASEEKVFERADTLQKEQKDTLIKLLDGMSGVNPDDIPPETLKQIEDMAARAGLPFDLVLEALKTQNDKRTFDESMARAQEARLSSNANESSTTTSANEVNQHINKQIATPEFKALSPEDKRDYIRSQGGDPYDYEPF